MGDPIPTREVAHSQIGEAVRASAPVRAEDRRFAARLVAIAAAVVGLGMVIVLLVALPQWLGPILGIIAGVAMTGAVALVVVVESRQHAFTRSGNRLFIATLLLFAVWAEVLWQLAIHSDWIAVSLREPDRAVHFVLLAVVGVLPLLAGAAVFRFRR